MPFCSQAYVIIKLVQKHFGEQLRFVFRNFPLSEVHSNAEPATEAAEFSGTYGLFWEMHDLIFENQNRLSIPTLLELSEILKLPVSDLMTAIENRVYEEKIKKDFLVGVRSGVNGTPTFFINNQRHDGSFDYEELVLVLHQATIHI